MCIFCDYQINAKNIVHENNSFFCIFDQFPVNKGHLLIVSKRHVESFFDLNDSEKIDLDRELSFMKRHIDLQFQPDGYNVGVNIGKASGQTIFHVHIHLIPRYLNDVEDPRGGVRGVIPHKQRY